MCVDPAFVVIKYKGPVGSHMVYSPLKKVVNYSMHTFGDVFCVHADDQATLPDLFELQAEAPTPAEARRALKLAAAANSGEDDGEPVSHAKRSKKNKGDEEDE